MGAAALDLAYVAAGRYDAYWEEHQAPWDIAAGLLLVKEAGGRCTDLAGKATMLRSGTILASNRIACSDPNDAISELMNTDRPDYFRDRYCLFDGMAGKILVCLLEWGRTPGVWNVLLETKLVGARRSASCRCRGAELLSDRE